MGDHAKRVAPSKAERIDWIDAAKGLGMVAVAAGHIWWRPGPAHALIYSFHMPLFFLLSGYVFKPKPLAGFAKRQLIGIGVPYLSFLLLLWAFDCWWESRQGHRPALTGWEGVKGLAYGGTALSGPFTVFWFAPCLLVSRLLQNLVAQKWPDPRTGAWVIIALASLAVGTWLGMSFRHSPLGLLTVPGAFFLLWAGHALRETKLPDWAYAVAVGLALISLLSALRFPGWEMNMKQADYGVPLLSMLGAIAISLTIFRIAKVPGASLLAPLGTASLVIMFVHVPVIHYGAALAGGWIMLPFCLLVSYGAYRLAALNRWTGLLFLGRSTE